MNKIMLVGVLEREPVLNYDEQGTALMQLYLVVNWFVKTDNDEAKRQIERFAVFTSEGLAEWGYRYLQLGDIIAVEGYLRMRHEQDSSSWRIMMDITAVNIKVITDDERDAEFEDEKIIWISRSMYLDWFHPFP
jgi:single-stranded DNA-binding protein